MSAVIRNVGPNTNLKKLLAAFGAGGCVITAQVKWKIVLKKLVQLSDLESEFSKTMGEFEKAVAHVGQELLKRGRIDTVRITILISEISVLSRKFLFLLPEIARIRAAEEERASPTPPELARWAKLSNEVYRCRTWMNQWSSIEVLIRRQIPPKRRKLFEKAPVEGDISIAQNFAYDKLLDDLYKILNPANQNDEARDHGCFADISLPHSLFLEYAHATRRILLSRRLKHPARFLDVGCGRGLKVLSAAAFFDRADGLEFDPGYVDAAKTLFKSTRADRCDVFQADALTYQDYDVYDAVYFYRPMRHIEMLKELENQVIKMVRPGTLLIAPYKMFEHRYEELGCARVERQIYITQTSQSDADKLRREAELTGSRSFDPTSIVPSIWEPILKASRAKGFGTTV